MTRWPPDTRGSSLWISLAAVRFYINARQGRTVNGATESTRGSGQQGLINGLEGRADLAYPPASYTLQLFS